MIKKWGGAFLVFLLGAGACSHGVKGVREGLANREPTRMACEQFLAQPPYDGWVHLSGAGGALRDSAIRTKNGATNRIYVPLTCGGSGPVRMVLATEDPALIRAVAAKQDMEVRRDVEGMVRRAKDHSTETTEGGPLEGGGCVHCPAKIANLGPDYVVIEENATPSVLIGAAWLLGAAVAFTFTGKMVLAPAD